MPQTLVTHGSAWERVLEAEPLVENGAKYEYQPTIGKTNPVSMAPARAPPIVGIGTGRNEHLYQSISTRRD